MRMSIVRFRCFSVLLRYFDSFFYRSYSALASCGVGSLVGGSTVSFPTLIFVMFASKRAFSRFEVNGLFARSATEGIAWLSRSIGCCAAWDALSPKPRLRLLGRSFGFSIGFPGLIVVGCESGVPSIFSTFSSEGGFDRCFYISSKCLRFSFVIAGPSNSCAFSVIWLISAPMSAVRMSSY